MSAATPHARPTVSLRNNPPDTAHAVISSDAVAHNLQWLRNKLDNTRSGATTPSIWAVVKADAYGHGLEHVITGLDKADGIAVLSFAGVYRLRALGWRKPVLVINAGADFSRGCLSAPALYPLHLVRSDERRGGKGWVSPCSSRW